MGRIGKGAQPATSPEMQERIVEGVPIRKEKLELDEWKLKFERMLRETNANSSLRFTRVVKVLVLPC